MFPLPALPLPRVFNGLESENAKSFAMLFGPLLLVQWLLPWGGGAWSWNMMGATLWSLIAGIGLTVLAFAPLAGLKKGHIFAACAGSGLVGVLWTTAATASPAQPFFINMFGMLGLVVAVSALFLRARNGEKALFTNLLWAGVVLFGLALFIPTGGQLPLIMIFKMLGVSSLNIVGRIFFMLLSLGFIFLLVLVVMNVLLKGSDAEAEQVERSALVILLYPFVALFLIGFFSFFDMFGVAMHTLIVLGTFGFLSIFGLVNVIEHTGRGQGLATLINAD